MSEGETLTRCSTANHQGIMLFPSLNSWEQIWQQGSISSPASKKSCLCVPACSSAGPVPYFAVEDGQVKSCSRNLAGQPHPQNSSTRARITVSVAVALASPQCSSSNESRQMYASSTELLSLLRDPAGSGSSAHLLLSPTIFTGPNLVPPGLDETMTLIYSG